MATKITNCQFCGGDHGMQCPSVKAIEYYPDGKLKRVEFKSAADYVPAQSWPSWPFTGPPVTSYTISDSGLAVVERGR